jgi:hypothetical protein
MYLSSHNSYGGFFPKLVIDSFNDIGVHILADV